MDSGDGDGEITGDGGAESCDKLGEETIGDGGGGSTTAELPEVVGWVDKNSTLLLGVSRKVRKEISFTEKVAKDGHG